MTTTWMLSQRLFNMNNSANNINFLSPLNHISGIHIPQEWNHCWATIYKNYVHRLHGGPLFSVPLCILYYYYAPFLFIVPFPWLLQVREDSTTSCDCWSGIPLLTHKGKGLDTCHSAAYMSQSRDQQRFAISEVAADWHEPMVSSTEGNSEYHKCSYHTHNTNTVIYHF